MCIIATCGGFAHHVLVIAAGAPTVMGHEVLQLVSEAGGWCTVESLRAAAALKFGEGAVFGNCHGSRFTFDELLDFLCAAGKLARAAGGVGLGHVPGCSGH